jgi:hypothetical protein
MWNILLLHKPTHMNLHSELTSINSNFLPDNPQVQFSALNTSHQNNKPVTICDHNSSTDMQQVLCVVVVKNTCLFTRNGLNSTPKCTKVGK